MLARLLMLLFVSLRPLDNTAVASEMRKRLTQESGFKVLVLGLYHFSSHYEDCLLRKKRHLNAHTRLPFGKLGCICFSSGERCHL